MATTTISHHALGVVEDVVAHLIDATGPDVHAQAVEMGIVEILVRLATASCASPLRCRTDQSAHVLARGRLRFDDLARLDCPDVKRRFVPLLAPILDRVDHGDLDAQAREQVRGIWLHLADDLGIAPPASVPTCSCAGCEETSSQMARCSGCKFVSYHLGTDCQVRRADWMALTRQRIDWQDVHRKQCRWLKGIV